MKSKKLVVLPKTLTVAKGISWTCLEEFGCQKRKEISNKLVENERIKDENEQQQKSLTEVNQVITESTMRYNCSVDKINHFKSLMKLYNGLDNYDLWKWIYSQVKEKVSLQYYKEPDSHKL